MSAPVSIGAPAQAAISALTRRPMRSGCQTADRWRSHADLVSPAMHRTSRTSADCLCHGQPRVARVLVLCLVHRDVLVCWQARATRLLALGKSPRVCKQGHRCVYALAALEQKVGSLLRLQSRRLPLQRKSLHPPNTSASLCRLPR